MWTIASCLGIPETFAYLGGWVLHLRLPGNSLGCLGHHIAGFDKLEVGVVASYAGCFGVAVLLVLQLLDSDGMVAQAKSADYEIVAVLGSAPGLVVLVRDDLGAKTVAVAGVGWSLERTRCLVSVATRAPFSFVVVAA